MPCYPAFALLLGCGIAAGGVWIKRGNRALTVIAGCAALACIAILVAVRHAGTPGDISSALSQHPEAYTLSLGHMEDLTLPSFAYLRWPLALAAVAFLIGALGTLKARSQSALIAAALMMVLFFHAARMAMVVFDPYLSSRPLAESLLQSPPGNLIVDHHYYWFSSVFFYTDRNALLLNGRYNNLVYGSYAPDAPQVFIDDVQFREFWVGSERNYLICHEEALPHLKDLVGDQRLNLVKSSGGKVLLTNSPTAGSQTQQ